ncbi:hypothetical protein BDQ17DRAFT_1335742 [Cyathus striatus]|nr:hypothetical protein BDQ17DRAFT_1335742 [Cyathus striatus]
MPNLSPTRSNNCFQFLSCMLDEDLNHMVQCVLDRTILYFTAEILWQFWAKFKDDEWNFLSQYIICAHWAWSVTEQEVELQLVVVTLCIWSVKMTWLHPSTPSVICLLPKGQATSEQPQKRKKKCTLLLMEVWNKTC